MKLLKTMPLQQNCRLINANKSGILQPQIQTMEYNKIVAVTGMPGLYEAINSKTDGAIVKSLDDQTTKFVSSRVHNLSHLESIEIYTVRENVTLADVFVEMKKSKLKLPDIKDNKEVKSYFEKVYPDMDFDRVYVSDMKKMVKWFEILEQHQIDYTVKPEEETTEEEVDETTVEPEVKKPKAVRTKAEKPATEKKAAEKAKPKSTGKKKSEE